MKLKAYLYIFTTFALCVSSIQCEIGILPKNSEIPTHDVKDIVEHQDKEGDGALKELLGGQSPDAVTRVKTLQKLVQPGTDLYSGINAINKNLGMAGGANTMMSKVTQLQNLIYPKLDLSKAIVEINKQFGQMGGANNIYAKVQFINQRLGSSGTSTVLKLTQITNLIGAGHAAGNRAAVGATTYDKLNNLLARLKAHHPRLKNAKTLEEAVTLLEGPAVQVKHTPPLHHNPISHK